MYQNYLSHVIMHQQANDNAVAPAQVMGQAVSSVFHAAIMLSWSVQYSAHVPQVTGQTPRTSGPIWAFAQKSAIAWQLPPKPRTRARSSKSWHTLKGGGSGGGEAGGGGTGGASGGRAAGSGDE